MKHQQLHHHHHDHHHHHHCEAVSSSSTVSPPVPDQSSAATSSSDKSPSAAAVDDATLPGRDGASQDAAVERRGDFAAVCRWSVQNFPKVKARVLFSKYFEVGGFDWRLLIYPKGDSQALPGYVSVYLQIMDPRGASASKWDCFASYRLSIVNVLDDSKTIQRDSWHRFSLKKKSHGWCDFTPASTIMDPKSGYMLSNESLLITADILVLNESVSFSRDSNNNNSSSSNSNNSDSQSGSSSSSLAGVVVPMTDVSSGKFTWKVHNFSLFKEMIKTQKIMSPTFPAGECNLRISVYQSSVNGVDHLSMCLESKDTEKAVLPDRSCWCLFRMSALNQMPGSNHMHRDSYGRFAADNKSGDNTSLGWNDYMKMADFTGADSGFLVDDTAVFSTSFHVIKEFSSFSKNGGLIAGGRNLARKSDGHMGKFTWKIDNFTKLKDILKKRKITGLCIKSRRFQIGNRDCRLIVYPRGQSQPPCHLSVFLEVTDSRNNSSEWSCFVSHRLSVVNQRIEDKSVTKESQNRYSKAAKDWGWREFVTLTSLFDQDSGFIVQDTVIFTAEVLILKETSISQDFTDEGESASSGSQIEKTGKRSSFMWKVENFLSFKEIMETRKIFSKFFQAGGCELRIGVYESFDTICIYLESDQSAGSDLEKNFWVRYRMGIINQKNPAKTIWKESSICTKSWNNSVLQFMKVSDMLEADAGFLVRDTVVFVCETLDCCPWFEFSDLEVLAFDEDQETLTTDPDELIDSEDSEELSGDEEDIFRNLLSRAGFHLTYGDNPSQPQVTLREKLLIDAGAIAGFLTGLRVYLDDPAKVKRLLLPAKLSGTAVGKKCTKTDGSSPSLMNLLMSVKVLQQAIIDLLLDIMVECCQPSESCDGESSDPNSKITHDGGEAGSQLEPNRDCGAVDSSQLVDGTADSDFNRSSSSSGVRNSDVHGVDILEIALPEKPLRQPKTPLGSDNASLRSKTKWPEQSEELLGLIINSLRALDGAVPQGCPEPRRRPQSAQKIALVLDKVPKNLECDLVALVPKLVEQAEHPLAAHVLIERIMKPDAEPSLRTPVFGALSQLECGSEVWELILHQAMELLGESNDEPLVATIDFIFKAASQCQHLPEAIRAVRVRLKDLGAEVSTCVLDFLSKTVNSWGDVAETILRDIDSDNDISNTWRALPYGLFFFGDNNGTANDWLHLGNDQSLCDARHFSDIYILIEMLSIPCLAVEASQKFERAVARGSLVAQAIAMVLERRLSQRLNLNSQFIGKKIQLMETEVEALEKFNSEKDDFTTVLGLAETLALSRDPHVKGFVKVLYTVLFKWFPDESYRGRILKRLVDRATASTSDSSHEVEVVMDILVILVSEEQYYIRLVLNMIREVAELANADRAALWHQLCTNEEEIIHLHDERKAEISSLVKEKTALLQKLIEAEATNNRLKSDMKAEMDRFAREKKELSDQAQEVESQLEWLRSEHDEEIMKFNTEKKTLQDRLHDAEMQISQLKSRKRDEMKKVMKEKNALAERLKSAEAARKRFDEELKRYATEKMTREELRQSLEDEVRRLTQTVGQTEGEKREKEEQVARCEAYIDGMESKLQACQQYIQSLEASLQEEMSRHAPLYGVGLEALSLKELETISRIHEDGLRQIHALQQRKGSPVGSPLVTQNHSVPHNQGLFPNNQGPPHMAVGLPPTLLQNGIGMHANGHVNGTIGPWFNHAT